MRAVLNNCNETHSMTCISCYYLLDRHELVDAAFDRINLDEIICHDWWIVHVSALNFGCRTRRRRRASRIAIGRSIHVRRRLVHRLSVRDVEIFVVRVKRRGMRELTEIEPANLRDLRLKSKNGNITYRINKLVRNLMIAN
jgi:hypothetical protein